MKLWAERQIQLHLSSNQMAYSSQNHLMLPIVFMITSLVEEMPRTNTVGAVEKWLLSINNDKSPGFDNLDGMLLRMVADSIATPICHIFNLSREESLCPQAWREVKVIPLSRVVNRPLLVQTADR